MSLPKRTPSKMKNPVRAEERLLGDAAGLEEGLGAFGDAARAAVVALHGGGSRMSQVSTRVGSA